jgi:hypothetical protein
VNAPKDALAGLLDEHSDERVTFGYAGAHFACGGFVSRTNYESITEATRAHLVQVLAKWVAEREVQAWEVGHDECCGVYLRHCAYASERNPYRARAEALGATESAGEGENGGRGGREAERGCTGDSGEEA